MSSHRDRDILSLASAAGLGAAAMYFLDPARGTRRMRGVREIEDRLERHDDGEDVPGLLGAGRPAESRFELLQESRSPTARLLTKVIGGAFVIGGIAGRDRFGAAGGVLGVAGLALLARGLSNEPLRRLTGIGAGRNAVRMRRAIEIDAAADIVFDYVTDWERWPEWMPNVLDVTRSLAPAVDGDPGPRMHWEVEGPMGSTVAWDAVTTRLIENECVSWRSTEDAAIQHAGTLQLVPTGLDSTRVQIDLSCNPIAGEVRHLVASIFGRDPAQQAKIALERLKSVIETGVVPRDAARPPKRQRIWSGPRHEDERFR